MSAPRVDEGWLVWVASRATGVPAGELLAGADVGALVGVITDITDFGDIGGTDGGRRAAAALASIARRQPFATGNLAAAWLAAVMLLAEAGIEPRLADGAAAALVVQACSPATLLDDIAAALVGGTGRSEPSRTWSCPVCGRTLHAYERAFVTTGPLLVGTSHFELAARCWYEHGAHDRDGRPFVGTCHDASGAPPAVVHDDGSGCLIVLHDDGALLLCPSSAGYRVTRLGEFHPADLVGGWERLEGTGEPLGEVPALESVLVAG